MRSPGSSAGTTWTTERLGRSRSSTPAIASPWNSRWSCRSRTWGQIGQPMDVPASGPAASAGPSRASIWPAIHPKLLELIRAHRSTIVFVNGRRLAERLAAQLNELADEDLVRTHHGSIAREQRLEVEDALKSGTCGRSSPPAAWSSASTWAPSTWWCRSNRPARSRAACSGSAAPAIRSASPAAARSSRSSGATCSRPPSSPSGCSPA